MRKITRCLRLTALAVLPAALFIVPVREASAQWVVSDPGTEANTFITHVTQLLQYIKEVQTALNAIQQVTMMSREVVQLAKHPSTNILNDIATISGVIQQSQGLGLSLAQMATTFQNQFAPFSPNPAVSYAAQYNNWATKALGALRGAANSAGYQGNMINNEQKFMAQMNQMIQQPNGQDQALQIGNSLGLEEIAQLEKLRLLMIQNGAADQAALTAALNAEQQRQTAQANGFVPVTFQSDNRAW
jgi:P-type conjugative transfer protein TrbJ